MNYLAILSAGCLFCSLPFTVYPLGRHILLLLQSSSLIVFPSLVGTLLLCIIQSANRKRIMKALNEAIKAVGRSMWVDQLDTGAHLILRHWSEAAFGGWVGEMGM